ncbi:MAG: hypothetical protein FD124_376 [Alphaproteobacteria bacterium]|nr:MAG: hypothetical protein FD160_76 [Caulobacteraceae bacterium]TPW08412.1 MAG: hypothetical protein FD124_376 [Alphaproteobacteria bacterium]
MTEVKDFLVDKSALRLNRFASADAIPGEGQALLRLDRFALTSNNVTYAAIGEQFGYWKFFPAPAPNGRVPVWGFADVVESKCADVAVGERIWGYYPIATHLVVTPMRVNTRGFVDGAAHRVSLPPVYNQYERVAADPAYRREHEGHIALFRPLFVTGFLIDDFLDESGFFGARRVMLSSASSKTALGLAKCLKDRAGVEVIGLTSARNAEFVRKIGYYDRVVSYERLGELPNDQPALLVDMAGDAPLIDALAHRLGDAFVYNCMVGGTHWETGARATEGPPRTLFFAPDRIMKRNKDWGADGFAARYATAWSGFLDSTAGWLKIIEKSGEEAVSDAWRALLDGQARPEEGYVLRV